MSSGRSGPSRWGLGPGAGVLPAGGPGHPVLLVEPSHWSAVAGTRLAGDAGARAYLAAREVTLVEYGGDVGDVDIDA